MNDEEKTSRIQGIENKLLSQIGKLCQEAEEELKTVHSGG